MKRYVISLIVLAATMIVVVASNTNIMEKKGSDNTKLLTTEQLWQSLEEAQKSRLPKTAKPLIEELRERIVNKKDTKAFLRLRDIEKKVRTQCYGKYDDKEYTDEEWNKMLIDEARSLWSPVKEVLLAGLYSTNSNNISIEEILSDNEEILASTKQDVVFCDEQGCIPSASLYDALVGKMLHQASGDSTIIKYWERHIEKTGDDISTILYALYKYMVDSDKPSDDASTVSVDIEALTTTAKSPTAKILVEYLRGVVSFNSIVDAECETQQEVEKIKSKIDDIISILTPVANSKEVGKTYASNADNMISRLQSSALSININGDKYGLVKIDPREKEINVQLIYQNLQSVDIVLYKTAKLNVKNLSTIGRTKIASVECKAWNGIAFNEIGNPLHAMIQEVKLPLDEVLPSEEYTLVAYRDGKVLTYKSFNMSQLSVFGVASSSKKYISVSDAKSGAPKENVKVDGAKSDNYGMAIVTTDEHTINVDDGHEKLQWNVGASVRDTKIKEENYYDVVTDRAIYRPGQKVQFKVWSYNAYNGNMKPNVAKKIKITLRTVDRQEFEVGKYVTNAWGTISGEYILPDDLYTGDVYLVVNNDYYHSITVEEYKRTNLSVSFKPIEGIVKKGDKVTIRGVVTQANGAPVANANVKWLTEKYNTTEGVCKTNDEGEFTFDVDITSYGVFSVNVTVTDLKGESINDYEYVKCSEEGSCMTIKVDNEYVMQGEDMTFKVILDNLNDGDWTSDVTYALHPIKNGEAIPGSQEKVFEQKECVTGKRTISIPTDSLVPGGYYLRVSTTLADGTYSEKQSAIYIVPKEDSKVDGFSDFWASHTSIANLGETIKLRVGTGLKEATAYYYLFSDAKLVSKQYVSLASEVKTLSVDMPKDMPLEGAVDVVVFVVGQNVEKEDVFPILLKEPKKELPITLKTYRDISTPRGHEKWTIQLGDSLFAAPLSEVVASMYDERLDKLVSEYMKSWADFKFKENRYRALINTFVGTINSTWRYNKYASVRDMEEERVRLSDFPRVSDFTMHNVSRYYAGNGRPMLMKSMALRASKESEDDEVQYELAYDCEEEAESIFGKEQSSMPPLEVEDIKRDDFSETVFFYPHLVSDKDGRVELEFDLPDNITTYKLQAIAHTQEMQMAYLSHRLAIRKELTVTMGAPRFAVEGDTINLTAVVECYSKDVNKVDCHLVVKDNNGNEYLAEQQQVALDGSVSAQAAWKVVVPNGVDNLTLSVSAKGDKHQDTEVTTMQVTRRCVETYESLPFVVVGKNYKNDYKHDAERIERQKRYGNGNLTFKYNSNAFVEVVDALPYLGEEWGNSADAYLGRVETSAIAMLIKSRPDVQKAICGVYKLPRLTNEGYNTPWHMDAKHMEKHTSDIYNVLSGDKAEKTLSQSLKKLRDLQKYDGSIAWCPGMNGSEYMTVAVADMIGRMVQMGLVSGADENVKALCKGMTKYIDTRIAKVAEEQRTSKSQYVGSWTVDMLYARALMPGKWTSDADYLVDILKRTAQGDMSESYRVSVATLYNQIGAKAECELMVKSLIENLQQPKEGLASVYVARLFYPTYAELKTQSMLAILLGRMDAMGRNGKNDDLVEVRNQLINWLIFQKRSSYWRDRQSTAIAVLAIMGANADMTSTDEVRIGNDSYTCTIDEPQLQLPRTHIERVEVEKSQEYPSWGAWQWTETTPQDELVATGSDDLQITRTIYVQRNGNYEKLVGNLKVGDIVKVELTLKAKVDMSFVHVRDHKAASFEHCDQTSSYVYPLWWWRTDRSIAPHYYQPHDSHIDFFIEHLERGESKVSYEATITNAGELSAGYAEVQCTFSPELVAKSGGSRIVILNINK
ncbi:MAG: alpha-2-macroglobulin family protein [Bacteroidia bacterium]|nr:alpha-2-macroglobulin family protein [Bacteroidia bacterium]